MCVQWGLKSSCSSAQSDQSSLSSCRKYASLAIQTATRKDSNDMPDVFLRVAVPNMIFFLSMKNLVVSNMSTSWRQYKRNYYLRFFFFCFFFFCFGKWTRPLSRCVTMHLRLTYLFHYILFCIHYKNMSIQIYRKFHLQKTENFQIKKNLTFFSYFCSKHRLWVLSEDVLTNTHNLCFWAEIRKIMYTPVKVLLYKSWV